MTHPSFLETFSGQVLGVGFPPLCTLEISLAPMCPGDLWKRGGLQPSSPSGRGGGRPPLTPLPPLEEGGGSNPTSTIHQFPLKSDPSRRRPYRVECTGSLSTSEVKQHRARLVLGWGTAWEDLRVLSAFRQIREKVKILSARSSRAHHPNSRASLVGCLGNAPPHSFAAEAIPMESGSL